MEENLQGAPVLCVMTHAGSRPRFNVVRKGFDGRGTLVLEDIDQWFGPFDMLDDEEDLSEVFMRASLSRGAREAIQFVRSAVENPEVHVFASCAKAHDVAPFFYDLLDPVSVFEIDKPDVAERTEIWTQALRAHPSLAHMSVGDLVRLSAGMARYDMCLAVRETLDEAYREGLAARRYAPVGEARLFEKLAAYQPLDSTVYSELEERVAQEFRARLIDASVDDVVDGSGLAGAFEREEGRELPEA